MKTVNTKKTEFIGCKVPPQVKARLVELAKSLELDLSHVVRDALRKYLVNRRVA